ncbi:ATP-binding protein [Streptomyces lycii]|uniref:ATP-binding protein n=1 Tax=Streptomyces lycii TaxID=2654337 RepID=A0ABQ7FM58_9ACTN|nr:ATP-binding protein [Streptomyces lycii]KAF4409787.1 ATP-binding protein [Streptomyces lycii]
MPTVSPEWTYALRLPHDPRAPRIARTTLRAVLGSHAMAGLRETAELLMSEMVTNAYRHTDGPSAVRLHGLPGGRLRVAVWDTDPTVPAPFDRPPCPAGREAARGIPEAAEDAESGRGLHIVRVCANDWGGWRLGGGSLVRGKLLWVEVARNSGFTMAA